MKIGKNNIWNIIFYICVVFYLINLICIFASGNCVFSESADAYNYISAVLDAIFLIIFFNFLKRGSLTPRYLLIMFGALVFLPFLIALIAGGIKF